MSIRVKFNVIVIYTFHLSEDNVTVRREFKLALTVKLFAKLIEP